MEIIFLDSRALAAPNLKDLPKTLAHVRVTFWWAIMPKRGNSPSPCNGLFALEGVSFATDFLRDLAPGEYPAGLVDGLTLPA
jgi:hypothetical protein